MRGAITGFGTALGGMLHTFPFLINSLPAALRIAYAVVVVELLSIALIRFRFMKTSLATTIVQVIIGGGSFSPLVSGLAGLAPTSRKRYQSGAGIIEREGLVTRVRIRADCLSFPTEAEIESLYPVESI